MQPEAANASSAATKADAQVAARCFAGNRASYSPDQKKSDNVVCYHPCERLGDGENSCMDRTGRKAGHDRSVDDKEVVERLQPQIRIDDGIWIMAHPAGAAGMM